ncbi:MAG: K+/H+ antiporter subunit F [Pseudobacteriovorax sp.]|nr:K+/H+ antiporter subunit F [Pseudobacteriovorax sp.]
MIWFAAIIFALIFASGVLAMYRVTKGPNNLDRILALDYLSLTAVAGILFLVLFTNSNLMIDLALCLAVVGFFSALIFSLYLTKEDT